MEVSRLIKAAAEQDSAPVVAVDAQGSYMCTANMHGECQLWSGVDGMLTVLRGHTKTVLACCFSPLGDIVCTSSADGTIRMWNTSGGECMQVGKTHTLSQPVILSWLRRARRHLVHMHF